MAQAATETIARISLSETLLLVTGYCKSAAQDIILKGLARRRIRWTYMEFEVVWRPPAFEGEGDPIDPFGDDDPWFWNAGPGVTLTIDWDASSAHRVGPKRPGPKHPKITWRVPEYRVKMIWLDRDDVMRWLYELRLAVPITPAPPAKPPAKPSANMPRRKRKPGRHRAFRQSEIQRIGKDYIDNHEKPESLKAFTNEVARLCKDAGVEFPGRTLAEKLLRPLYESRVAK